MIDLLLLVAAKLLLGWLLADLIGGVLHWVEDRLLSERLPIVGPLIVAPNRAHHARPADFLTGGVVARNATTWAAAAIVSIAWLLAFGPSLIWLSASIGGALSSSVHAAAHRPGPSRWLRALQDIGLIQSAAQHARHHRAPSDRAYCVLTGWTNPLLDALGVWPALERALRRVGVRLAAD